MDRRRQTGWMLGIGAAVLAVALLAAACSSSGGDKATATPGSPAATGSPGATTAVSPQSSGPAIPDRYKGTYNELEATLSKFETTLPSGAPKVADIGVISTSLIMANSNTGAAVLRPAVLDSVKTYLDDMKRLGSTGVEVQISYPVGSKDYPNQAAYTKFYQQVVAEAHQRGFKVLIETSCIFSNSPFTDVQFDFSKLTPAAYFQARTDQIVTIARDIKPDYLSFGEEPVNERVFAGIQYKPDEYVAFVNGAAAAVRRELGGNTGPVKIGVGTGTWEADLFTRFVNETDLDFYDIHIYPLQGTPGGLETARSMAKQVQAKGKAPIIGETWLYKMSQSEFGATSGATAAEAFRRDAFSFWEPLDARYIRDVLALGSELKMPFVSFWGARFLFAQVEWTAKLDAMDFKGISSVVNPMITSGLVTEDLGPLGKDWKKLLGK